MIRINLLPHRERRRAENKKAFYRLLILAAIFGGAIVAAVGLFIETKISEQDLRNTYIKAENAKLDEQIKEIATIKEEIAALKARQQAVEDLQSDRNQPVYLLDELVKQVPEGVFLKSFKQEGQKVALVGVAQSNQRVSELLHNFANNSPWLEAPQLIEIHAATNGSGKETKRVYEFTMNVGIKRPRDQEKAAAAAANSASAPPANAATPAPAATGSGASNPSPANPAAAAKAASNASATAPGMPKKP